MEILEYETVWSGAMEAAGLAPGLSNFIGRSQIAPQHAMVYFEDLSGLDDFSEAPRIGPHARVSWDQARDGDAVALLEQGLSLASVARVLKTSKWCIRRVAVRRGIKLGPAGWDTPRAYRGAA